MPRRISNDPGFYAAVLLLGICGTIYIAGIGSLLEAAHSLASPFIPPAHWLYHNIQTHQVGWFRWTLLVQGYLAIRLLQRIAYRLRPNKWPEDYMSSRSKFGRSSFETFGQYQLRGLLNGTLEPSSLSNENRLQLMVELDQMRTISNRGRTAGGGLSSMHHG